MKQEVLVESIGGGRMCIDKKDGKVICKIIENKSISNGIYQMILGGSSIAREGLPGQFVNLYCSLEGHLLPRPISICEINQNKGWFRLVYADVGFGTGSFSKLRSGDEIEVLGPLGKGYELIDLEDSILVGGGVGIPPLLELAKRLKGEKEIFLGFRTESYLVEDFKAYGKVFVATEDGSQGFHGNVIELMNKEILKGKNIYACGPTPMLKSLKQWALERQIPMQLSLEERMGCGFGACVGCACKVKSENETGFTYKKVCKDGPVFDGMEVIFE